MTRTVVVVRCGAVVGGGEVGGGDVGGGTVVTGTVVVVVVVVVDVVDEVEVVAVDVVVGAAVDVVVIRSVVVALAFFFTGSDRLTLAAPVISSTVQSPANATRPAEVTSARRLRNRFRSFLIRTRFSIDQSGVTVSAARQQYHATRER